MIIGFLDEAASQLNPIEIISKSIKKVISRTFIKDQKMMVDTVKADFIEFSRSKSFCERWVDVFLK